MTATPRSLRLPLAAGVTALLSVPAVAAWAGPLSGSAGYEYYRGPFDQEIRAMVAVGAMTLGTTELFAQAAHFDDGVLGEGASLTAGGGFALTGPLAGRAEATLVLGDEPADAWLLRVGPELRLGDGGSVAGYYERYDPDAGQSWNGLAGEVLVPVRPRLHARATASYAAAGASARSAQLSVGAHWQALWRLELAGEAGWARVKGEGPGPPPLSRGPLGGLPIVGDAGNDTEPGAQGGAPARDSTPTFLLGVRVLFP